MVAQPNAKEETLRYLLSRLDEQIRIELELVGQRMNVLGVSQAFLFTAFTTDMLVSKGSLDRLKTELLWMIPILGMVICVIVALALYAAVCVIQARKSEREKIRDLLREELENGCMKSDMLRNSRMQILEHVAPRSWPDRLGNWPPVFLGPFIFLCWLILFISVITLKMPV